MSHGLTLIQSESLKQFSRAFTLIEYKTSCLLWKMSSSTFVMFCLVCYYFQLTRDEFEATVVW